MFFGTASGYFATNRGYKPNGARHLGASPSAKSVERIKTKINGVFTPGNVEPWTKVKERLNRLLGCWSAYFGYGSRGEHYKAVDHHVCGRVRHFLARRHKVSNRGTRRFSSWRWIPPWASR